MENIVEKIINDILEEEKAQPLIYKTVVSYSKKYLSFVYSEPKRDTTPIKNYIAGNVRRKFNPKTRTIEVSLYDGMNYTINSVLRKCAYDMISLMREERLPKTKYLSKRLKMHFTHYSIAAQNDLYNIYKYSQTSKDKAVVKNIANLLIAWDNKYN